MVNQCNTELDTIAHKLGDLGACQIRQPFPATVSSNFVNASHGLDFIISISIGIMNSHFKTLAVCKNETDLCREVALL